MKVFESYYKELLQELEKYPQSTADSTHRRELQEYIQKHEESMRRELNDEVTLIIGTKRIMSFKWSTGDKKQLKSISFQLK